MSLIQSVVRGFFSFVNNKSQSYQYFIEQCFNILPIVGSDLSISASNQKIRITYYTNRNQYVVIYLEYDENDIELELSFILLLDNDKYTITLAQSTNKLSYVCIETAIHNNNVVYKYRPFTD